MKLASEAEIASALEALSTHAAVLDGIVQSSAEPLEGNIFYMHQSFDPNPKNLAKQRNLFSLAASLPAEDAIVIEIGFNAGHSSLLMLSAHSTLRVIAFDLCEHSYTKPCFHALSAIYPGRIELVPGRSQQTIPRWAHSPSARADLIHIDGDHEAEAARLDLVQGVAVSRPGAWVVFDDICFSPLKAVWNEMLSAGVIRLPELHFCPTNRHGIARYARQASKACDELLWDLTPAIEHRGRTRHVLVLAPTDHGQDSLLGYLTKQRPWQGRAPHCRKLSPNSTERHQSQWISLPLRFQLPDDTLPCLLHLVAPPFHDNQQIADCFPVVDGILVVVDCSEGLTGNLRANFAAATGRGLQPVLFLNKLDKLLSLESNNEVCYQRLSALIEELNSLFPGSPSVVRQLAVEHGSVIFGRGSLSVADAVGGWGFSLNGILGAFAGHKGWTKERVEGLKPRLWGDHHYDGRRWGIAGERGFCKFVLQPIREVFSMLEARKLADMTKLAELGIVPAEGMIGNAWKHSAMEAWLPLADVLLGAVAHGVPPPPAPTAGSVFYSARCIESLDGRSCFAFGREVSPQSIAPGIARVDSSGSSESWFLNGPTAVMLSSVNSARGCLRGVVLDLPSRGAFTVSV